MTLVEFLRARLDEDQAAAVDWRENYSPQHPSLFDPARVLVEVKAKRRRVDVLAELLRWRHLARDVEKLLRLEALPYAGHAAYDESWRPA